jgi:hypothetical protein
MSGKRIDLLTFAGLVGALAVLALFAVLAI